MCNVFLYSIYTNLVFLCVICIRIPKDCGKDQSDCKTSQGYEKQNIGRILHKVMAQIILLLRKVNIRY